MPQAARTALLTLLCALAACGAQTGDRAAPPGAAAALDRWRPFVREAAARFRIQEDWIDTVLRQAPAAGAGGIAPTGAMGLMQVLPDTYLEMRERYGLGSDPFDPRDNILAGSAYLKEMAERYGEKGALTAYHAGAERMEAHLRRGAPLPEGTVAFVAAAGPLPGKPLPAVPPAQGAPLLPAAVAQAKAATPAAAKPEPVAPRPPVVAEPARPIQERAKDPPAPPPPAAEPAKPAQVATKEPPAPQAEAASGAWGIQVGAYASMAVARQKAERARAALPDLLGSASVDLPTTSLPGTPVAYRARLIGLADQRGAVAACAKLAKAGTACYPVRPGA